MGEEIFDYFIVGFILKVTVIVAGKLVGKISLIVFKDGGNVCVIAVVFLCKFNDRPIVDIYLLVIEVFPLFFILSGL